MPRNHSGLLLEDGEELGLPAVVREELVELLGDDCGTVLGDNTYSLYAVFSASGGAP